MKFAASLCIGLVGSLASCSAPPKQAAQPAQSAATERTEPPGWLTGVWLGEHDGAVIEEYWTPLTGGNMLGAGRESKDGKLVFFEHLRIEDRGGTWYYVALPYGRSSTDFKLARGTREELVFENPEHDFPQRISYRLLPDGGLLVRVEGSANGTARAEEYRLSR